MTGILSRAIMLAVLVAAPFTTATAWAHCDGLDGPVVAAARDALATGDVAQTLIWVPAGKEAEIRTAFDEVMAVRNLSPEAQSLADRYFFETLVRVHRAGEGAPYTGLKPAGRNLGPAIPAADHAIETGSDEALVQLLTEMTRDGLRVRFKTVTDRKAFRPGDVVAGREFTQAYVTFIHYVERLYQAAGQPSGGHYPED